ncbi:Tyrosine recombinase XerC [Halioglobus japonicus]|nr:Tyrosine recombinase XerC [Halioglobus japonicus]
MPRDIVLLRNPNHPKKGSSIKVEPITRLADIQSIKTLLADNPRDLCLFTLGINTAYRANELVSIRIGQIAHLRPGDRLDLKQSKNGKYRCTTMNDKVYAAVHDWLDVHPEPSADAPLFRSHKTREALSAVSVTALAKQWCAAIGLKGNYGSHTLRKTWGYHQRKTFNKPLALLTRAFGHGSEWQTLEYLCIQPAELEELYAEAL